MGYVDERRYRRRISRECVNPQGRYAREGLVQVIGGGDHMVEPMWPKSRMLQAAEGKISKPEDDRKRVTRKFFSPLAWY